MTKEFEKLVEVANVINDYFGLCSYELHHYDEGSYADLHVREIKDLAELLRLSAGIPMKILADDNYMIIRLVELNSNC